MEFLSDIFHYSYLLNATLCCLLSGITCGIIGTYIVSRRTVFLSGGITHASFGGMGIAFYLGADPILGAMIFAIASSLGIEYATSHSRIREDSAIGIIWSLGMAIGAFFLTLRPGYTSGDLSSFLFGSIIAVTKTDTVALLAVSSLLLIAALLWIRPVMYAAFDKEFSRASGMHTSLIGYLMAAITALVIVLSIRIMGIVLLISLLTMPAVAVNFLTKDYIRITIWSSLLASVCALLGIMLSYYLEVASGPAIIFILSIALAATKCVAAIKNKD